MLVLDTDHLTEYQKGTSVEAKRLKQRLDVALEPYVTTILRRPMNLDRPSARWLTPLCAPSGRLENRSKPPPCET